MLTNAAAKAARPAARPYKMGDAGGLYLLVAPTGRRTWRMKFRFLKKEKLLTIGSYPDVSLSDARARRDAAREQLRRGEDPSGARRRAQDIAAAAALESCFETVARAWHAHQAKRWSPGHAAEVITSLERDVFPAIGAMRLASIATPTVLKMLRAVESRGRLETTRRLRQRVSAVFAFAMSEGVATSDPAAIVVKALTPPGAQRRQPAIVDLDEARALLAAAELVDAAPAIKLASRFLALTAVRLAAVRGATWAEFEDLDWSGELIGPRRPMWRVPAARMKLAAAKKSDAANDHLVPLSREAVDVLRAARAIAGAGELVFPGRGPGRPIGEAAIGALYGRAGYAGRHVPHGWRSTFSTIMNERDALDRADIDRALGHVAKDRVEAAYNRAEHLARRRWLFAEWAALLCNGSAGASRLGGGTQVALGPRRASNRP